MMYRIYSTQYRVFLIFWLRDKIIPQYASKHKRHFMAQVVTTFHKLTQSNYYETGTRVPVLILVRVPGF